MLGEVDRQGALFSYVSLERRVPEDHPLRQIKEQVDTVLASMSSELEGMYAHTGRPSSVAPEQLLKASLLMALYSVRQDRLFCEMLDYNLLFRRFLDIDMESRSFDHSTFWKNRKRLIEHDVAKRFFANVMALASSQALLSDEHFTVDGTLIEAWASFKIFKSKDGPPPPSGSDGSGMVDFKGERRGNATHASSTDPEAKLMRKGNGQPAKLSHGAYTLMENRSGQLVDLHITDATLTEDKAEAVLVERRRFAREQLSTLGADKGYHNKAFVASLRRRGIRPYIARIEARTTPGLDDRITRHESYRISQQKRIEEIFGWMKTMGGLRESHFIGQARTQLAAYLVGAAYNLMRMTKLSEQSV